MLPDRFFLWPESYGNSLATCVAEIEPILLKSGLADWVRCIEGNLAEHIALVCRTWNISPWWLLTSAQREQSSLTTPHMEPKAVAAWLGVVNADVGRTTLPGYYGVHMQVQRFAEACAWLLGVEDSRKWPSYVRTQKESPRYQLGKTLDVTQTDVPGAPTEKYTPLSAGEFCQLAFTPHMPVLAVNEKIAYQITPLKYLS